MSDDREMFIPGVRQVGGPTLIMGRCATCRHAHAFVGLNDHRHLECANPTLIVAANEPGYDARHVSLRVSPDFGCVMYEAKE